MAFSSFFPSSHHSSLSLSPTVAFLAFALYLILPSTAVLELRRHRHRELCPDPADRAAAADDRAAEHNPAHPAADYRPAADHRPAAHRLNRAHAICCDHRGATNPRRGDAAGPELERRLPARRSDCGSDRGVGLDHGAHLW